MLWTSYVCSFFAPEAVGAEARVFHEAFAKPEHASVREVCRERYRARECSLEAMKSAKDRLYATLPILFRNVQVIRFMWYRLAVVANLLPDGLADFLSLAMQQQEELLENIRRVRRESEQAPLSLLEASSSLQHSCLFAELFVEDSAYNHRRHNFLNDACGDAALTLYQF